MMWPWSKRTHTAHEQREAEQRVQAVRLHLRVLLNELQTTLDRIEDKRRRGMPGA